MAVPYTETLTAYKPNQAINAADLNVLASAVTLVGTITANIHRGTEAASQAAYTLGIVNAQAGTLYTSVDNAAKIGDRYVFADQFGDLWVVRGRVDIRRRFPATAHIKALVTLLLVKPAGVP